MKRWYELYLRSGIARFSFSTLFSFPDASYDLCVECKVARKIHRSKPHKFKEKP